MADYCLLAAIGGQGGKREAVVGRTAMGAGQETAGSDVVERLWWLLLEPCSRVQVEKLASESEL